MERRWMDILSVFLSWRLRSKSAGGLHAWNNKEKEILLLCTFSFHSFIHFMLYGIVEVGGIISCAQQALLGAWGYHSKLGKGLQRFQTELGLISQPTISSSQISSLEIIPKSKLRQKIFFDVLSPFLWH